LRRRCGASVQPWRAARCSSRLRSRRIRSTGQCGV
jgi:hypothetical protein